MFFKSFTVCTFISYHISLSSTLHLRCGLESGPFSAVVVEGKWDKSRAQSYLWLNYVNEN